jgi:predicted Zn-dependent protease with MMP-like domain
MADARIGPDAFEELVADVLDALPEDFHAKMDNVEVVVEEWPSREEMRSVGLRPGETLFGLYQGIPRTQRTTAYNLVLPDKISIFRGPLLAYCGHQPERLREEVRRVVLHEIAHHFGLGEQRLRELGY